MVQTDVKEFSNGAWQTWFTDGPGTQSQSIYNLNPDTPYSFEVQVEYNFDPTQTQNWYTSNPAAATTFLPLVGSPTLTATVASSTAVNLTWTSVPNAQQYVLDCWTNNPKSLLFADPLPSNSTQFPVQNLSPYTSYSFQVTAEDGVNTSSASNIPSVTTLPATPTNVTATAISATQVNVSWSGVAQATSYVVANVQNGTVTPLAYAGTSLSAQLSGLSPYTPYNLEVGAYGAWGISWSSGQPVTTLPAPIVLSATPISPTQINLSWTSVPKATEYILCEFGIAGTTSYAYTGTATSFPPRA